MIIADALIKAFHAADSQEHPVILNVVYKVAGELESAFPNFDRMRFINYIDEHRYT